MSYYDTTKPYMITEFYNLESGSWGGHSSSNAYPLSNLGTDFRNEFWSSSLGGTFLMEWTSNPLGSSKNIDLVYMNGLVSHQLQDLVILVTFETSGNSYTASYDPATRQAICRAKCANQPDGEDLTPGDKIQFTFVGVAGSVQMGTLKLCCESSGSYITPYLGTKISYDTPMTSEMFRTLGGGVYKREDNNNLRNVIFNYEGSQYADYEDWVWGLRKEDTIYKPKLWMPAMCDEQSARLAVFGILTENPYIYSMNARIGGTIGIQEI